MIWLVFLVIAGVGGVISATLVRQRIRQLRSLQVDVDKLRQYQAQLATLASTPVDVSHEATIERLNRRLRNASRIRREQFRATRYTKTSNTAERK